MFGVGFVIVFQEVLLLRRHISFHKENKFQTSTINLKAVNKITDEPKCVDIFQNISDFGYYHYSLMFGPPLNGEDICTLQQNINAN